MSRAYYINGETMVTVSNNALGGTQQLGLADSPIVINMNFRHDDIRVDTFGNAGIPPELQFMLADVSISMTLIHFDASILNTCIKESMGGAPAIGQLPRAGTLQGGQVALGAAGNHFISMGLSSPVGGQPWLFYATYLANSPVNFPLGTERSAVRCNWRAIPFSTDPWGGGTGSQGVPIWAFQSLT